MIKVKLPKLSSFIIIVLVMAVMFWFATPSRPSLNIKGRVGYEINYVNIDSRYPANPLIFNANMYAIPESPTAMRLRLVDVNISGETVEPLRDFVQEGVIIVNFTPVGVVESIDFPPQMNKTLAEVFTTFMFLAEAATPPKAGEHWVYDGAEYNLVAIGRLEKTRTELHVPECEKVELITYEFFPRTSEAFWQDRNKGEKKYVCTLSDGTQYTSESTINLKKLKRFNKGLEY